MLKFSFVNKQQETINVEFLQHANTVVITNEDGTRNIAVDETFFNAIAKSKKHNNVKTWKTISNALTETYNAASADFLGVGVLLNFSAIATAKVLKLQLDAVAA